MSAAVLTYGEALLKMILPTAERLENLSRLEAQCAGSELNVAAALAALGTPAGWVSALPESPLGAWVRSQVRGLGVQDLSLTRPGRLGSFYLENHHAPRPSRVVYDRAGSSFAGLTVADFEANWLDGYAALHISGISLALGKGPRDLALALINEARERHMLISFDVNHRRQLLSDPEAFTVYLPALEHADLIFVAQRDSPLLGGIDGLRDLNQHATIIQTRGAAGSQAHGPQQISIQSAIPTSGPGRIGRGDAFAGAYLHAHLQGATPSEALAFAAAAAALKTTTPGDQLQASADEVRAVLEAVDSGGEPLR